jgi:hypothetical protein
MLRILFASLVLATVVTVDLVAPVAHAGNVG